MSNSLLKQILVQGTDGPEAVFIKGDQIKATDGQTFESHSADIEYHISTIPDTDGKVLISKANGTNEWSTAIATKDDVTAAVSTLESAIASGVNVRGTVGTDGTVENLPSTGYALGDMYVVKTPGTFAGQVCEPGDSALCIKAYAAADASDTDWAILQKNIDGAVTGPASAANENLPLFDGASGKVLKDSGITLSTMNDVITKSHEHTSALVDIEDAVSKRHAHANSVNLDKLGESADGSLTYNGKGVTGARTVASLEEASAAGAPQGTLFFVVEQQTA